MRIGGLIILLCSTATSTRAESISIWTADSTRPLRLWNWTHSAFGEGTANVFDGGPVVFDSAQTNNLVDPTAQFIALDITRPGSSGAGATASRISEIIATANFFQVRVRNSSDYIGSIFSGGDRPGGMAESELHSVIEFEMPTEQLEWTYRLLISQGFGWTGSTHVRVENVSQSQILLDLSPRISQMD